MNKDDYIAYLKREKGLAEALLRDCVITLDRRDPAHAELQDRITEFFGGLREAENPGCPLYESNALNKAVDVIDGAVD